MPTAANDGRRPVLSATFVVACAVMALAAFVGHPLLLARVGAMEKEAVPLKAPLSKLTKEGIGPYKFRASIPLPAAVAEALGAKDHIDWQLVDTSIKNPKTSAEDPRNPLYWVHMMVSYHTGGFDVVPHTPDQCYLGQGYQPVSTENTEVDVPSMGGSIPIRVLEFVSSELHGRQKLTVVYFFHCNGKFVVDRSEVRYLINSLTDRGAYFCKIQLTFGSGNSQPIHATREESIAATAKFLNYILPPLVENHLPDWEAITRENKTRETNAAR